MVGADSEEGRQSGLFAAVLAHNASTGLPAVDGTPGSEEGISLDTTRRLRQGNSNPGGAATCARMCARMDAERGKTLSDFHPVYD